MRFLNIDANSLTVIVLFIIIYLINFVNLFIIIRIELKAVLSLILENKLVIKFIVISFYRIEKQNSDYNAPYN